MSGSVSCLKSEIRRDILLDSGWKFIRQDVPDAETVNFDDHSWLSLNLPHTWNNRDGQDGGNNYYRGIGWYRRHLTLPAAFRNRSLFLKFDAAFLVADVYVNGHFAGEHRGGFAAFVFDVSPWLRTGADNVIAVKVNNACDPNVPPLDADFTFFGGIYRDVHLLVTSPVQISPLDYGSSGVHLKTMDVNSRSANLQVVTVVSNSTASPQSVNLRAVILGAGSNVVEASSQTLFLPATCTSNAVINMVVKNPHLWNGLADPYLYQIVSELWQDTNLIDQVTQPLGFRSFKVNPTNGFYLNGRPYDLHGVSMHQDWLNCGWALNDAQRETNFAILKELGATAVRLSHYEKDDQIYQLADRAGIVLWSEIPLIDRITESPEFYANAKQQLRELIRQRGNHPSVICWGIFNEITFGKLSPTNLVHQLARLAVKEDPTRPSTAATAASDDNPVNWYSDLIAFNKYYGWYGGTFGDFGKWADAIHAKYPDRCIGVGEYGAGASIYQHSENPVAQPKPGGRFHPEEYQNLFHEAYWQAIKKRPFLWAKFVWNLFDFAVAGRNEGDTPGRNDKGLVTYDRLKRKDAFYFYQANWTTKPMVHITGHTFTNRLTKTMTAKVYANCDSVELFLNGVSQGSTSSTNCIFEWPLKLAVGSNAVQAIGSKGGIHVTDALEWCVEQLPPAAGSLKLSTLHNPILSSSNNLRDPSVIKIGKGYHLFYSRYSKGDWNDASNWAVAGVFTRDFVHFENDHDISSKGFASPGDVVFWHGRWILPYQSYPVSPLRLCYSESSDLTNWSAPQYFLKQAARLPWNEAHRVIDPSFVISDGTLHCFFIGTGFRTNAAGQRIQGNLMGHAITRDPKLEKWKILTPIKPLIGFSDTATDGVENTMVFQTGNHWTMIYSEGLQHQHLALAISDDLVNWRLQGPIHFQHQRWMAKLCGAPYVWRDGSQWLMMLMGTDENDHTTFGLLTSPNGREWKPLPESSQ